MREISMLQYQSGSLAGSGVLEIALPVTALSLECSNFECTLFRFVLLVPPALAIGCELRCVRCGHRTCNYGSMPLTSARPMLKPAEWLEHKAQRLRSDRMDRFIGDFFENDPVELPPAGRELVRAATAPIEYPYLYQYACRSPRMYTEFRLLQSADPNLHHTECEADYFKSTESRRHDGKCSHSVTLLGKLVPAAVQQPVRQLDRSVYA